VRLDLQTVSGGPLALAVGAVCILFVCECKDPSAGRRNSPSIRRQVQKSLRSSSAIGAAVR
jgi:hypothetical protein